ncbi:MAG: hypothetical protein V2A79_03050 [Planctomycetota bacterium]
MDLATAHPVVLLRVGKRYRVVHGHTRLTMLHGRTDVKQIRCLVLPPGAGHNAVIIASRMNLDRGVLLKLHEKRRAFLREVKARRAAGLPMPSNREFARAYRVAPGTPAHWLETPGQETPRGSASGATATQGVRIGHAELTGGGPRTTVMTSTLCPGKRWIYYAGSGRTEKETTQTGPAPCNAARSLNTVSSPSVAGQADGPDTSTGTSSAAPPIRDPAGIADAVSQPQVAADRVTPPRGLRSVEAVVAEFQAAGRLFLDDLTGRPLPPKQFADHRSLLAQLQAVQAAPADHEEEAA